jgi:hypothetical protein
MKKLLILISLLLSCDSNTTTAPSSAQTLHNVNGIGPTVCEITIHGHIYLCLAGYGGIIHAEHCNCKTTKEPK